MTVTPPDLREELAWCGRGAGLVAGMDEVGRGALAGVVTVGVTVVGPPQIATPFPPGLTDSKLLSGAARERLEPLVREWVVAWGVGHSTPEEIDAVGIIVALRRAGERALAVAEATCGPVRCVILDGKHDWLTPPPGNLVDDLVAPGSLVGGGGDGLAAPRREVRTIVKGDQRCASVAAASVLAKCERDRLMTAAHAAHPQFGWDSNKGYGARAHLDALRELGPCDLHRRSWALPERSPVTVGAEDAR